MRYIIRCRDGRRWKVIEAVSLKAALNCISRATVSGSIGGMDTISDVIPGVKFDERSMQILTHVVQINSDGTEREPYTGAY